MWKEKGIEKHARRKRSLSIIENRGSKEFWEGKSNFQARIFLLWYNNNVEME